METPARREKAPQSYTWSKSGRASSTKTSFNRGVGPLTYKEKETLLKPYEPGELDALVTKAFPAFELKDFQREAINAINKKTNVCVMAGTGSGKSMCFQALGLRDNAVVLIVSPLLRLEKEQVS